MSSASLHLWRTAIKLTHYNFLGIFWIFGQANFFHIKKPSQNSPLEPKPDDWIVNLWFKCNSDLVKNWLSEPEWNQNGIRFEQDAELELNQILLTHITTNEPDLKNDSPEWNQRQRVNWPEFILMSIYATNSIAEICHKMEYTSCEFKGTKYENS